MRKHLIIRFFVFILICSIYSTSNAQTNISFSGLIEDVMDHSRVEFANVTLLSPDSVFIEGTVTDSLGRFSLTPKNLNTNQNYILQITHLSYNKKSIQTRPSDSIKLSLAPNGYNLSEVEVKAVRTKVRNRLNMEYTVTDAIRGKCDLTSEILERIPSVFIDVNNNVYVKGSSNVLILRDGIKISSNSLLDLIPSGSVQKVIVSYHVPSRYANQNYTSVLNIITKRADGITLQIKPKISFDGSWYDTKCNLNLEKGKNSFQFYYQLYYRKLVEHKSSELSDKSLNIDSISLLKVKPLRIVGNQLFGGYTFHITNNLQFGVDGYWDLYRQNTQESYEDGLRSNYERFHEKYNTQNYKAFVDYKDSVNKVQWSMSYNNEDVNDIDTYYQKFRITNQKAVKDAYNTELDYVRNINQNIEMDAGFKYSHVKNIGIYGYQNATSSDRYNGNSFSAFSEASFILSNALTFDFGINLYDYQRRFEDGTEVNSFHFYPKATISYSWNKVNNLTFDYSSRINEPSLWNLLPFVREQSPDVYYAGTSNLKPMKNSILSLEYSYSKGNAYLSISPYYKQVRDLIVTRAESYEDGSLVKYTNLKKYKEWGIDFTYSNSLFKWWMINLYAKGSYQNIPYNEYYKKELCSIDAQIVSYWSLSARWSLIAQYKYNGRNLTYNGYNKPDNSCLAQLTYKVNHYLKVGLLYTYPFENMKDRSCLYYKDGYIKTSNITDAQKILLTCTFNLNKGKKSVQKAIFQNTDKKYE